MRNFDVVGIVSMMVYFSKRNFQEILDEHQYALFVGYSNDPNDTVASPHFSSYFFQNHLLYPRIASFCL